MKGIVFSWSTVIVVLVAAILFIWRPWESVTTLEISPASINLPNGPVTSSRPQANSAVPIPDVVGLSGIPQELGNLVVSIDEQKQKAESTVPPLADSDGYVRGLIAKIPVNDLPLFEWIDGEELILRLVEAVEIFSAGQVPRSFKALLKPDGKFVVNKVNDKYLMATTNYARFDKVINRFMDISPSVVAGVLKNCEPLLAKALIIVGNEKSFRYLLRRISRDVSITPLISKDIELLRPKVLYTFADPDLENLSPLQKQLLRMGPDNTKRIQAYLEELFLDFGLNEN